MSKLNYKHLHYFWTVANEGSIAAAGARLHVTPQSISTQLKSLERHWGAPLFRREGRRLVPTELGETVRGYAEEIFSLGQELDGVVRSRATAAPRRLRVAVVDAVPKLIAYRLLRPTLGDGDNTPHLICREGRLEELLDELVRHRLDLVIADRPAISDANVRLYSHKLIECGISFMAAPGLARGLADGFPDCLDTVPMLLPAGGVPLRHALDQWFADAGVSPRVVGEFDDSALMKAFGHAGIGVFPCADLIESEVAGQYAAVCVGRTDRVGESYYALSAHRRLAHPGVSAIAGGA
ncbi:LysR family transcriptional regulator [Salinisphaera sp. PC39]|uniref:transcriptional activator NhaR n=1 Tax=Salinisphaera sp. PC39 TaxID=1304156 RepID=UPI00333F8B5F